MRKEYIAISTVRGVWGRDEAPKDIIRKVMGCKDINDPVSFEGTRLIEVQYPDGETDADDISFSTKDANYTLIGNTSATHYDGIEIYDFLEGA